MILRRGGGGVVKSFRDRLLIFSTGSAILKPQYFFNFNNFFNSTKKGGGVKNGLASMCYEKIFHMLQYFADFHYNGNTRPLKTYTLSMQTLIWCIELVQEKNGRDLTQPYDRSPYTDRKIQKATWQHKFIFKLMYTCIFYYLNELRLKASWGGGGPRHILF